MASTLAPLKASKTEWADVEREGMNTADQGHFGISLPTKQRRGCRALSARQAVLTALEA